MINLNKHLSFFDPLTAVKKNIHIIGCGAIGSTVAEMLTRMGIEALTLYDFDTVSPHNIANQLFRDKDIGQPKVDTLEEILKEINPVVKITKHKKGWTNQTLDGYVFLCVDNIELRKQICEENEYNNSIDSIYDFRMRLTDAQHYAADWRNPEQKTALLKSMQFTHDEAKQETPTNACGTSLNIVSTVRVITALGLANFINFTKGDKLKKLILIDAFDFFVESY